MKKIIHAVRGSCAFTLVELIVVIVILAILGTISFIALQGYAASARDVKRLNDVKSLESKLIFENALWTPMTKLLSGSISQTGITIAWSDAFPTIWVVDFQVLKENQASFQDPSTKKDYNVAYVMWSYTNSQNKKDRYNFLQLAYLEETTNTYRCVGNYYKINPETDSWSLFDGTPYECGVEGDGSKTSGGENWGDDGWNWGWWDGGGGGWWDNYVNCAAEMKDWYDVPATNHWEKTPTLTRTGSLSSWNWYVEYSWSYTCYNWSFVLNWETPNVICGDTNYIPQEVEGNYACVENKCQWEIPQYAISNATSQPVSETWHHSDIWGECTFTCNENYIWNGNSCELNICRFDQSLMDWCVFQ